MELLGYLFVHKPLNILIVAGLFLVASRALGATEFGRGKNPRVLVVPAVAWACYAAWELFVMLKSPEANIRVDLLVILPVLAILSIWFVIRALR